MHPMLKPALRRAWRDRATVQFGITPAQAVVVSPVDPATGHFLELLDGTQGLPILYERARALDMTPERVDELLARLTAAGVVDDPTASGPAADVLRGRADTAERLRPDLASLSLIHPEPGDAARTLGARRAIRVQVRGAGRVGATIAAVLSGAGVGRVDVLDGGVARPGDVAPGGLPERAVGERRSTAAGRLVRDAAPGGPPRQGRGAEPDALRLIVAAPREALDVYAPNEADAEEWVGAGIPHLYAGVVEATGVVGPLVLPGGTGCAGCLSLGRTERDPGWPRLLAQWRSGRQRRAATPACDLALATAVAGLAAAHALAFLDGDLPETTGSRWEVSLPRLDWRSTPIEPHRDCFCGAVGNTRGERASAAVGPHDTMAR
ncbi:ThiF family adenylyltransferase [Streptomyces hundungensis]|nr:ThiF family adenylyltransferase [Streptomyces hundungensis]